MTNWRFSQPISYAEPLDSIIRRLLAISSALLKIHSIRWISLAPSQGSIWTRVRPTAPSSGAIWNDSWSETDRTLFDVATKCETSSVKASWIILFCSKSSGNEDIKSLYQVFSSTLLFIQGYSFGNLPLTFKVALGDDLQSDSSIARARWRPFDWGVIPIMPIPVGSFLSTLSSRDSIPLGITILSKFVFSRISNRFMWLETNEILSERIKSIFKM